jgi:hypothetical protein
MEDDPEKKRRGRKPKDQDVSVPAETKRGRKPKTIYNTYSVTETSAVANMPSLSDDENIIVRLNVNPSECDANDAPKFEDEQHPYAYNRDEYRDILSLSSFDQQPECSPIVPHIDQSHKVVNILKDFEKNKNKEWPSNTSISCYWCCHRFDNAPFGIPITYQHGTFNVFGCFCSLECAAAHNFNTTNNLDDMWERYNLINLLSRKIQHANRVRPAPDRLALKIFGGYMEIDQFRRFGSGSKVININFPPMSSISQQIEEINEHELNSDYKFIPLDHDRINKIKEQMVIKRVKPLVNNKNSLESSMNLKVSMPA